MGRVGWRPNPGTISITRLLDTYTGAAAAYSLRKLRSTYTGYAIRVRRSSDNTSQDIGFDANGDLDTISLTNFVGTTAAYSGYVSIWYDQSGRTNDVINTTAVNQPVIILNGVLITQFSKPAIKFNGTNNTLSKTGLDFTVNGLTAMSIVSVINTIRDNSTDPSGIMHIGPDSGWGTIAQSANIRRIGWRFGTGQSNNTMSFTLPSNVNNSIISTYHNNNTEVLRTNGVDRITYTNKLNAIANTGQMLMLGFNYMFGGGRYHSGTMSELIVFTTNHLDYRAALETEINNNYNVY